MYGYAINNRDRKDALKNPSAHPHTVGAQIQSNLEWMILHTHTHMHTHAHRAVLGIGVMDFLGAGKVSTETHYCCNSLDDRSAAFYMTQGSAVTRHTNEKSSTMTWCCSLSIWFVVVLSSKWPICSCFGPFTALLYIIQITLNDWPYVSIEVTRLKDSKEKSIRVPFVSYLFFKATHHVVKEF